MPSIYFTVTKDLTYDQRMDRICTSLSNAGYNIVLVGRKRKNSLPLTTKNYAEVRLNCIFNKGALFYSEYNLRLFFYLLGKQPLAVCAIDLDTILPCYFISQIKKCVRIYDAHELFCEMKEVASRPFIYRIWKRVEKFTVPRFKIGYTVNKPIADEFFKMYGVQYEVIRNIARFEQPVQIARENLILYQGAINEGRSFETLIPAMQYVDAKLILCGDGNFMEKAKQLAKQYKLDQKIVFTGMVQPDKLREYTRKALIGITIFEKGALSNFYSLANRFFDYIHGGLPQLCANYPVYRELNDEFKVAVMLDDLSAENIAEELNGLLNDPSRWNILHNNCIEAAKKLNWQEEEKKLISYYKTFLG